uniref:Uncharacterized protein n=1 Tax=Siphoviridae sp. ctoiW10 TaxID=2827592 RepID=A0A8S5LP59_9CAUD|nr:MAG TPA: hypothetical protein [Siphoviridae sp. ctoiW10]
MCHCLSFVETRVSMRRGCWGSLPKKLTSTFIR